MTFREIFGFECAYQLRRLPTWLAAGALLVFSFLMTRDGSLAEALQDEFFLNSPFAIAKTTVTGSLIWLLLGAFVAGDAAARDLATRIAPLTYTTPIGKGAYLGGRFLAALALNALILLAVPAGSLLAVYAPGVAAELIGPFRPAAFLTAYAYLALPTALVATALQFALALRSGRPLAGFLGSVILFALAYVVATFFFLQGRQGTAHLLDPIGVHFILSDLSFAWTPTEKRWRLLTPTGTILANRLLWLGAGLLTLAITFLRFRFEHRVARSWRVRGPRAARSAPAPVGGARAAATTSVVPQVRRRFGLATHARQTLAIARDSFLAIVRSVPGLAFLVGPPLLAIPVIVDQMELNGVPLAPATGRVIAELTAPLTGELSRWVLVPLCIVFFTGGLVWRERDARLDEIADAMPVSGWAPLLGKFLGLGLVLALFAGLLTLAGIAAQLLLGYDAIDPGLYLQILFGLQLPEYLLFAVLTFAVYAIVGRRYIAHMVAIGAYVSIALAPLFGIEHNLLVYSAGPAWSHTEMRGFADSLGPWLWFKLYWAAWAVLLAVAARLFWARGRAGGRLRRARRRLAGPTAGFAATAGLAILALGGFIFYNTNLLNTYQGPQEIARRAAEYERRYGQYREDPQPHIADTDLRIELYPARGQAEIAGSYRLVNRDTAPIASIHLATVAGGATTTVTLDRSTTGAQIDDEVGHRSYTLARPLEPGDALRLDFAVRIAPRGFREDGVASPIAANGTYFTNQEWLPAIGYDRRRELTGAADRREYGLVPRSPIAPLDDAAATAGRGGGSNLAAIIGTDEGQVAVAPGALRRTWAADGRRYFDYAADGPIGNEFAFFSADYAIREERWNGVAIRIFHHPAHAANLDRTVRSIRASLDYYSAQFGPYPRSHLTIVERPGAGASLHAEPSLISYQEGFAGWSPRDDPGSLDLPFAVMAHEMAHQWTVPYAVVEGAPVLSEGVAWYYGLKAVEHARGREQRELLLRFMRQPQPYPPIRRGEPLLRGLDPYLSYRKGPFALYAMSAYIGEERVNAALRRLVERHRAADAPLATMRDLYRELLAVTPDTHRALLRELFEVNTVWTFASGPATAVQTASGDWQVTLAVRARKVVYDEAGVEREVPLDDWVAIGAFAPGADGADGAEVGPPLATRWHRLSAAEQTITFTVPERPARVGVDPDHLLEVTEAENDDNTVEVTNGR